MNSINTLLLSLALTALSAATATAAGLASPTRQQAGAPSALPGEPIDFIALGAKYGESSFSIAYPTGRVAVADSIRAWENALMGGSYKGTLTDTAALFTHYAQRLTTIDEGYHESCQWTALVAAESEGVVTLASSWYFYGGGAHGQGTEAGATFRKTDGAQFGRDLVAHFDQLRPLVARGLRAYFDVTTNSEMLQCLQLGSIEPPTRIDEIPAPQTLPWVEGDSVVMVYNHYEIACYAAGTPTVKMSLSEVWPWLSPAWREALRQTAPVGNQGQQDEEWCVGAMNMEEQ